MTVPRYKAKRLHGGAWDIMDLAADGTTVLCSVPEAVVIDVTEALNAGL